MPSYLYLYARPAIESAATVVVSPFLVSAVGLPGHTFTVIVDVDTPAFKLASLEET